MVLLQEKEVVLSHGNSEKWQKPLQITQVVISKVQRKQLRAIETLLEPDETVHAATRAFSVDFNSYSEIALRAGNVVCCMPGVYCHWIVDLFPFHSSLKAVGEKLQAAIKSDSIGQRSTNSNRRQSRVSSLAADRERENSFDVDPLTKLAKLH